jgi:hypothetical protein
VRVGGSSADRNRDDQVCVYRTDGSPLMLLAIGSLFAAFGIWAVIVSIGNLLGLLICSVWLASVVWWVGFAYAYDAALMRGGVTQFRSLCRRRTVDVSAIKRIKKSWGGNGAGSWLVVRYRGGRVCMGDGADEMEFVRRVRELNPAIALGRNVIE